MGLRRGRRGAAAVLFGTGLLALGPGCGTDGTGPATGPPELPSLEQVIQTTKRDIDALAELLGSQASVRQEFVGDCEPHQPEKGKNFTYQVHVQIQPGALARLRGEVAEQLAGQGWTVTRDPDESVRFTKDGAHMGASVWEDVSMAAVGGTSACVGAD